MIDRSTYPFYLTMLRKDFHSTFIPALKGYITAGILICTLLFGVFFYALMSQNTPVTFYDPNVDRFQYDFHKDAPDDVIVIDEEVVEIDYIFDGVTITSFTISMILFLIFLINWAVIYGRLYEKIRRNGALRTITLYSVRMEDLMTSKSLNGLLFANILYLICIVPVAVLLLFFGVDFFSLLAFSVLLALVMSLIVILGLSMTGFAMRYRVKGFMIGTSPSTLVLMGFFLLSTNIIVTSIARYLYAWFRWEYTRPFIANIMYISPFHFLGRSFNFLIHGDPMSPFDFLWIFYFIPLIIVGYRSFRGVYPDLFIKETA
ncbi:MAG: hypothetical protein ACMUIG_08260 [Thermoplasmatota archaeon]